LKKRRCVRRQRTAASQKVDLPFVFLYIFWKVATVRKTASCEREKSGGRRKLRTESERES